MTTTDLPPLPQKPWTMACGHTTHAFNTRTNTPSCVICVGIHPGADTLVTADDRPDLTGRRARCNYSMKTGTCQPTRNMRVATATEVDSAWGLAFFEHRPDAEFDAYYCGCFGWD